MSIVLWASQARDYNKSTLLDENCCCDDPTGPCLRASSQLENVDIIDITDTVRIQNIQCKSENAKLHVLDRLDNF